MKQTENSLHIVAEITPKPEFYNEGLKAITKIIHPTRAEEGCIRFDVYGDNANQEYILIEHFKDKSSLDMHYQQQYTREVFSLYQTILAKEPKIRYLSPVPETTEADQTGSRFDIGIENLRKIDGKAGTDVIEKLSAISPALARYVVEYPFGDIYARSGLSLPSRELATIAMLCALGDTHAQLRVHIQAGLNVGLTFEAIEEVILQTTVYAGFPRALNAMAVLGEIKATLENTAA